MLQTLSPADRLVDDVSSLGNLRVGAKRGDASAIRQAAQQFESLLFEQMLKSMRAAVPQSDLWDSDQSKMFQGMFDQQLSVTLTQKRGFGLADMLLRQVLPSSANHPAKAADATGVVAPSRPDAVDAHGQSHPTKAVSRGAQPPTVTSLSASAVASTAQGAGQDRLNAFLDRVGDGLKVAADVLGVTPLAVAAHAALESGWGKREILTASGQPSHNLFGIKAGPGWTGKVAETVTTEYVNGQPVKKVERFRAYDSYADGLQDYARMLGGNARYRDALNRGDDVTGFALALQKGGYATDPQYASKLARVANHPLLRATLG